MDHERTFERPLTYRFPKSIAQRPSFTPACHFPQFIAPQSDSEHLTSPFYAFPDWPLALMPLRLPSSHVLIFVYAYIRGWLLPLAWCGTLPEGSPCSTSNTRIDKLSHRFIDDCDDKTFCSGSVDTTCIPKRCRTDLFPFGYKDEDILPPLCDPGLYCPDEGAGCRPLVDVGQPCQMNQDRQCTPPSDWEELASDWNFNGSLCLGSVCSCVCFL